MEKKNTPEVTKKKWRLYCSKLIYKLDYLK